MTIDTWVIFMSIAFIGFIAYLLYDRHVTFKRWLQEIDKLLQHHNDEADRWQREREQLLDRVTAESFREYKTQQIRLTKAQNKSEPEFPHLELL